MCHMTRGYPPALGHCSTKKSKSRLSLTLNVWGGGCRYSGLTRRVGGVRNCSRKTRAENRICFSLGLDEWFT